MRMVGTRRTGAREIERKELEITHKKKVSQENYVLDDTGEQRNTQRRLASRAVWSTLKCQPQTTTVYLEETANFFSKSDEWIMFVASTFSFNPFKLAFCVRMHKYVRACRYFEIACCPINSIRS